MDEFDVSEVIISESTDSLLIRHLSVGDERDVDGTVAVLDEHGGGDDWQDIFRMSEKENTDATGSDVIPLLKREQGSVCEKKLHGIDCERNGKEDDKVSRARRESVPVLPQRHSSRCQSIDKHAEDGDGATHESEKIESSLKEDIGEKDRNHQFHRTGYLESQCRCVTGDEEIGQIRAEGDDTTEEHDELSDHIGLVDDIGLEDGDERQ